MKIERIRASFICSFPDGTKLYFDERSREALEALQAVAEKKSTVPKVMTICGASGVGKTGLLRSFVSQLQQASEEHSLYLPAEELLADLILQISRDHTDAFTLELAACTTLVIDNIDALHGKSATLRFLTRVAEKMAPGSHLILISRSENANEAFSLLHPTCYTLCAADEYEAKLSYAKDLIREANMQIEDKLVNRIIAPLPIRSIRSALLRCCALPEAGPEEVLKIY